MKSYLRDYVKEVCRAIWSGLGITDTTVIVVILIFVLVNYAFGTNYEHPSGPLIAVLAISFIVFKVLQGSYQLYARERFRREQLEHRLVPQIRAELPQLADTFVALAQDRPQLPATYVRLPIKNTSAGTARECSAKLMKIEFLDCEGWRQLPYNDTLDMAWANKASGTRQIDLAPGSTDLLDVVYAVEGAQEMRLATIVRPSYPGLMSQAGQYQFTIEVTTADMAPQIVRLRVHWGFDRQTLSFPADPIESL